MSQSIFPSKPKNIFEAITTETDQTVRVPVVHMSDVYAPQVGMHFLLMNPTPYGGFTAQE